MQIPTLACDICKCRIQVQDSLLATSGLAISGEGFEWVINRDNRWELVPAERPAEARTHICHGCLDGLAEYFSKRDDKPPQPAATERLSSPTHPSQEEPPSQMGQPDRSAAGQPGH